MREETSNLGWECQSLELIIESWYYVPLRYLKNIKNGKVLAPTLLPLHGSLSEEGNLPSLHFGSSR